MNPNESGSMRLAEFVVANEERILQEFEDFARTHTIAGESMDLTALRDHASPILHAIALDMNQPQTRAAQAEKSKGDTPLSQESASTPAAKHGADRAGSGFTIAEMFSEYRALRASVLRLWTESRRALDETDLRDLMRFNEAIDQALAESVTEFTSNIGESREMFLGILGHDLRSPLDAVLAASSFLTTDGGLTGANLTMASRIRSSARRMRTLVSDLLDFTRSRLGGGIPVEPVDTDIDEIAREVIAEIDASYPGSEFRFETSGNVRGQWDGKRVTQALSNLIGNARQHGSDGTLITVTARGKAEEVAVSVHNHGPAIPGDDRRVLFEPYKRRSAGQQGDDPDSMGLGLYIAQQIALAHGGTIDVQSSADRGTTFTLHLPRHKTLPVQKQV
jgi:signal transduction histidine kinase